MTHTIKQSWTTFKSIFTGMGVTIRHFFRPAVTELYPEEKVELPEGARTKLFVNIDDCIGCRLCERACPVNCITIETVNATSDVDLGKTSNGKPKRFLLPQFDIDMAKCMYCNLCVYPCPTECIYMEPDYEYSEYDRSNLMYHFTDMTPEQAVEAREKAEQEAEEKKRQREEMMKKKAEAKKKKMAAQAESSASKDDGQEQEKESEPGKKSE